MDDFLWQRSGTLTYRYDSIGGIALLGRIGESVMSFSVTPQTGGYKRSDNRRILSVLPLALCFPAGASSFSFCVEGYFGAPGKVQLPLIM